MHTGKTARQRGSGGVGKRILTTALSAILAFGNVVTPTPALADDSGGSESLYPSVREHIAKNLDTSLVGVGKAVPQRKLMGLRSTPKVVTGTTTSPVGDDINVSTPSGAASLKESGHYMTVRYLLADSSMLKPGDTIDSMWERAGATGDEAGAPPAVLAQYMSKVPVYDPQDGGDYWVAFLDSTVMNGAGEVIHVDFTEDNTTGTVLDGCIMDLESGIAYIPKSLWFNDEGQEIAYATAAQMLVSYDNAKAPKNTYFDATVTSERSDVVPFEHQMSLAATSVDTEIVIPVANDDTKANVRLSDLDVYVGDMETPIKLVDGVSGSYDVRTGNLTLAASPMTLTKIRVVVKSPDIVTQAVDKVTMPTSANAALTDDAAMKAYRLLPNINYDEMAVGDWFKYRTQFWQGGNSASSSYPVEAGYLWTAPIELVGQDVADWLAEGLWTGYTLDDLRNSLNQSDASWKNIPNSVDFLMRLPNEKLTVTVGPNEGKTFDFSHTIDTANDDLPLSCSHSTKPDVDSSGVSYGGGYMAQGTIDMWMKTLAKGQDGGGKYVIMGFVSCRYGDTQWNQEGVGVYKFYVNDAPGRLTLKKKSSDESVTNGNPNFDLSGAVYHVYNTNWDGDMSEAMFRTKDTGLWLVTDSTGQAHDWYNRSKNYVELPAGEYWVVEEYNKKWGTTKNYDFEPESTTHIDPTMDGTQRSSVWYKVTVEPFPEGGNDTNVAWVSNSNEWSNKYVYDKPMTDPIRVRKLVKSGSTVVSGYDLSGTRFRIDYWPGTYESLADIPTAMPDNLDSDDTQWGQQHWFLTTNSNGFASTDDLGIDIPVGTIVIQETRPPANFLLVQDPKVYHVGSGETNETITYTVEDPAPDTPPDTPGTPGGHDKLQMGYVRIVKRDAQTGKEVPQGDASLNGTIFRIVYAGRELTAEEKAAAAEQGITVLEPGQELASDILQAGKDLEYNVLNGKWMVRETKAGEGYKLPAINDVTKEVNSSATTYAFDDQVFRGGVRVKKVDADNGADSEAQGTRPLAGAEFEIINRSAASVYVQGRDYAVGAVIPASVTGLVTGNDGTATTTSNMLPYGTYEIRESKAPEGYSLSSKTITVKIRDDNTIVDTTGDPKNWFEDKIERGAVRIEKRDAQTGEQSAQGAATLAGAEFSIYNVSGSNVTTVKQKGEEEKSYPSTTLEAVQGNGARSSDDREVCLVLTTDENGVAKSSAGALPVGKYVAVETKAPTGYKLNESFVMPFTVSKDGSLASLVEDNSCKDQVIRANMAFRKVAEDTGEPLADVMFVIQSNTTGERHFMVSDADGWVDTSKLYNGATISGGAGTHTFETNKPDTKVIYNAPGFRDIVVDSAFITGQNLGWSGKWFYGNTADAALARTLTDQGVELTRTAGLSAPPDNKLGALPFDTYTVYEVNSTSNAGYQLVDPFTVVVGASDDGKTISVDPKTDRIGERMTTEALDKATKTHYGSAGDNAAIIDTVKMTNLVGGEHYVLDAWLVDGKTGEIYLDNAGEEVRVTKEFDAPKGSGPQDFTTNVELAWKGANLVGRTVTVMERLTNKQGDVVTMHPAGENALPCKEQSVTYGGMSTVLTTEDGLKTANAADGDIVLIDTVSVDGLDAGVTYTGKGWLVDKKSGQKIAGSDWSNDSIKATSDAISYKVRFDINAEDLAGKTVVAYETLERDGKVFAEHRDAEDPAQAVSIPKLSTTAYVENEEDKEVPAREDVTIHDLVVLDGLTPGARYRLEASLVNAETGDLIYSADEIAVSGSKKFTCGEDDRMKVTVDLPLDASKLTGTRMVCFETLYALDENGRDVDVVGEHKDLKDKDQTVWTPGVKTTATDSENEGHVGLRSKKTVIKDSVELRDLTPGADYTLVGEVHLRTADGKDGGVLKQNGEEVVQSRKVSGNNTERTEEFEFAVDTEATGGCTLVVYETLLRDGKVVAVHHDIDDMSQTVCYPEIRTSAHDMDMNQEIYLAGEKITVIDEIEWKGIRPNVEYKINGELYVIGEDGEPEGEPVSTAERSFIPETVDGKTSITFVVDAAKVAGKKVVAFEKLSLGENVIALHEDPNDKSQTTTYPDIATKAVEQNYQDKVFLAGPDTIEDTVEYHGLTPGLEYVMTANLVRANEKGEETAKVQHEVASVTFTPEKESGEVVVPIKVDATNLSGRLVCYEYLTQAGRKVAQHEDSSDEAQTVYVPKIGTTLTGKEGAKSVLSEELVELTDTIAYEGLQTGREYVAEGKLLILSDKGKAGLVAATGEAAFTPETESGTTTVTFQVPGAAIAGKKVVAFERVTLDGRAVAIHEDETDDDQIVTIPEIQTIAHGKETGDKTVAAGKSTVIDTVAFRGLTPGETYTLSGTLHAIAVALENGHEVLTDLGAVQGATGSLTFVPEFEAGTKDVEITVDTTTVAGQRLVAFEELRDSSGRLVARHEDANDEGQSVSIPSIHTNAYDEADGDKYVDADKVNVVDVVTYEGLTPGREYTLSGVLHVGSSSSSSTASAASGTSNQQGTNNGQQTQANNGQQTQAQTNNGQQGSTVSTQSTWSNGGSSTWQNGQQAQANNGQSQQGTSNAQQTQTTSSQQQSQTTGQQTQANNGQQAQANNGQQTQATDSQQQSQTQTTGQQAQANGNQQDANNGQQTQTQTNGQQKSGGVRDEGAILGSEASVTFTPTEPNGSIEVVMPVNAAEYDGKKIVAFERLTADELIIATHEDINDADQTVTVGENPEGSGKVNKPGSGAPSGTTKNTMFETGVWLFSALLLVGLALFGMSFMKRRGEAKALTQAEAAEAVMVAEAVEGLPAPEPDGRHTEGSEAEGEEAVDPEPEEETDDGSGTKPEEDAPAADFEEEAMTVAETEAEAEANEEAEAEEAETAPEGEAAHVTADDGEPVEGETVEPPAEEPEEPEGPDESEESEGPGESEEPEEPVSNGKHFGKHFAPREDADED